MKNRIIAILSIAAVMTAGCGGRQTEKETEMGPEEVLSSFCRAIAGGEFDSAAQLCDTLTMKEYISSYSQAWDMLKKENGDGVSVAGGILASAEISIEEISKDANKRIIDYTIKAGDNLVKKKKATVKKEEGEWKVEEITDRQ